MKLSAVLGRGSKKNFIDLYSSYHHNISQQRGSKINLEKSMKFASEKYPDHEDFVMMAARALVYFADAEKEPMPRMIIDVEWESVKAYFELEVPKLIKRFLRIR